MDNNNDRWTKAMCKIVISMVVTWSIFLLLLAYI
jgi:hypothetical protein